MKLEKYDCLAYRCDVCTGYHKHIDMHNDDICWDCWYEKQK